MFNHILVAIDGSPLALKAAEIAVELALRFQSRVTMLHVARRFVVPEHLREYLSAEHLTGEPTYALDEATGKVMTQIRADATARGLKGVRQVVREGKPARTIIDYAKKNKVDAIVMGSRGLTELEGILLGSVSHKVASLAECTVIVAR